MYIDQDKCIQCGECVDACPSGMISEEGGQMGISSGCVNSRGCPAATVCSQEAILRYDKSPDPRAVPCIACPVHCEIPVDGTGDCQMMTNKDGKIVRKVALTPYQDVQRHLKPDYDPVIQKPLLTGIGAGTCYAKPPTLIVKDKVGGVDVVTSVSECHYLFAGIKVKIDTEMYVGEEGSKVYHDGKEVGMVGKEHYGSKYLELGNVNTLNQGLDGWKAAKVVADIANRKPAMLKVDGGSTLQIQVGEKPVIDGTLSERRRFGCGGDVGKTLGTMYLKEVHEKGIVNEGIVIDRGYTGRFGVTASDVSVDPWSKPIMKSGIRMKFVNPVYFCLPHEGGKGWGCTPLQNGIDILEEFDPDTIPVGYTILVTEPSVNRVALYQFTKDKAFKEIAVPAEVMKGIEEFKNVCEPSRVSGYFVAGAGGTARKSLTQKPLRLSEAVLERKARVSIGGAPAFVFTGGGINCMVDVEEVSPGSFYWTAAPAVVAPLEFTMKLDDYVSIGGFADHVRPLADVLKGKR